MLDAWGGVAVKDGAIQRGSPFGPQIGTPAPARESGPACSHVPANLVGTAGTKLQAALARLERDGFALRLSESVRRNQRGGEVLGPPGWLRAAGGHTVG